MRISDWSSDVCSSDLAVIDIVRMPDAMQPAAAPGLIAGVALIGDDPVELIDPLWLMEQYETTRAAGAGPRRPLCRLADADDGWGENFLGPDLGEDGSRSVSNKESGEEAPAPLVCRSADGDPWATQGGAEP